MSVLTKEVQESTAVALRRDGGGTEVMVLKFRGGEGQAVSSLAEMIGNSAVTGRPDPIISFQRRPSP